MRKTLLVIFFAAWLGLPGFRETIAASEFASLIKKPSTVMIILEDAGAAAEFIGYAEGLLKKSLKEAGAVVINPELMEKVKQNKLLLKAIQNANASAMARIATDYGADLLIRGTLSADVRQKFAASWEGTAALTLSAIHTATAREVANVTTDPFGTAMYPAPIEDAPLIAKQMAVKSVCENALEQLGIMFDKAALKGVTTIALELWGIFPSVSGKAMAIKLSPNGRYLLAAGGSMVEQWDLENKQLTQTYKIKGGQATALAVASDSRTLAVGDHKGFVHIFKENDIEAVIKVRCHRNGVTALAFSPDIGVLVSSSRDKTIQTMNPALGKKLTTLKGHRRAVNSIAVTPDGRHAISAGDDLSIKMWDLNVGKEKKSIQESADKLLTMVLSLDGSMVAASTVDVHIDLLRKTRQDVRHIIIRNTVTGEEIRTLAGHEKDVTTLVFHPDRRFLASGSVDNTIRIWDLQKGDVVTIITQDDDVAGLDFSDNGKWFAALSTNQSITVWKLQ